MKTVYKTRGGRISGRDKKRYETRAISQKEKKISTKYDIIQNFGQSLAFIHLLTTNNDNLT